MSLYPTDKILKGEDFSITEKYADWLRNDKWTKGYSNLLAGAYPSNSLPKDADGLFWVLMSTATEEIGSKIYSKIENFTRNLHDIDVCDIRALAAYSDLLDNNDNLNYLTYSYPDEILQLINIFSINKNKLFSSNSPLLTDPLTEIKLSSNTALSTIISGLTSGIKTNASTMQHYVNPNNANYSISEWEEITSLSGNPTKYFIPDDKKYLDYVEQTFIDCISANIFKRYRFDEVNNINSYIWQNISANLDADNLFLENNSQDDDILKLKIRLDVDIDFPEVKIVNNIEEGLDLLQNYNTKEKLVLQAEINRRKPPKFENSLEKFAYEREKEVIRYFRFISNFSPYIISSTFSIYNVEPDDPKLLLSAGVDSPIIKTNPLRVDDQFIYSAAKYLTNICLRISYLRENLRNLALKYAYSGTSLIIRKLIIDYLNKFVYDYNETWRYNNGVSGEFKYLNIPARLDAAVKIIEYWDSSEYYNISSLTKAEYDTLLSNSDELSTLNDPYWVNIPDTTQTLEDSEILSFYKRLGLKLNVNPLQENTDVEISKLYSFLEEIFESASLSDFDTDIKSSFLNRLSDYSSGMSLYDFDLYSQNKINDAAEPLTFFNGFTGKTTLFYSDKFKLPPAISTVYEDYNIEASAVIEATSSTLAIVFSEDGVGRELANSQYLNLAKEVIDDILSDISEKVSPEQAAEYRNTLYTRLLNDQTAGFYTAITYLPEAQLISTLPYRFSGKISDIRFVGINKNGITGNFTGKLDIIPPTHYELPESSLIITGKTYRFGISGVLENSTTFDNSFFYDVYKKYIGNNLGKNRAANHKNAIHPSYMLHPFLRRFVTRTFPFSQFTRIVEAVYENDDEILAKKTARISSTGALINSWKYDNREYVGYQTFYEDSPNLNTDSVEDPKIDVDGPWYFPALTSYIGGKASFINSIASGTNTYYTDIGLTTAELTRIAGVLASTSGNVTLGLDSSTIAGSKIYKTAVDAFGNTYTLLKSNREFETQGSLWIRFKNQPLSLPAWLIIENTDHATIKSALSAVYDFDVDDNYIWCLSKHPISGNVTIGQIYKDGFNVDIQNDSIKQFETFSLSGWRYAGAYTSYNEDLGTYHIVTVATSGQNNFGGLYYDNAAGAYALPVKYFVFNPGYGDFTYTNKYYVNYNESSALTTAGKVKNIYKISRNANNDTASIAFESAKPDVGNSNWYNVFGFKPSVNYSALYNNFGTQWTSELPDNSITILTGRELRSIGPYLYDIEVDEVRYVYPFSDVSYFGLFNTSQGSASVQNLKYPDFCANEDDMLLEYRIQFFSNNYPSTSNPAYFAINSSPTIKVYTANDQITLDSTAANTVSVILSASAPSGYFYLAENGISTNNSDILYYKYPVRYTGRNRLIINTDFDSGGFVDLLFSEDSYVIDRSRVSLYAFETEKNQLLITESTNN